MFSVLVEEFGVPGTTVCCELGGVVCAGGAAGVGGVRGVGPAACDAVVGAWVSVAGVGADGGGDVAG